VGPGLLNSLGQERKLLKSLWQNALISNMTGAETQITLKRFFNRLACATVADEGLAKAYVDTLTNYLAALVEDWQPVDLWSIDEYEQVCEFVHNNAQWILNCSIALNTLADAGSLLAAHKMFLTENGLLQETLARRPHSSFSPTPTREVTSGGNLIVSNPSSGRTQWVDSGGTQPQSAH
jgi:hypothetical protein